MTLTSLRPVFVPNQETLARHRDKPGEPSGRFLQKNSFQSEGIDSGGFGGHRSRFRTVREARKVLSLWIDNGFTNGEIEISVQEPGL